MSSAAAYDEVPFSELLREPAITTERLQKIRSLRLRRRDAEDLILFKASRVESEEQVTEVT
ncbi:MAG: hypothetical protein ACREP9_11100, partial [Candidatus Dormibacteraceae bacterium]